MTDFILLLILTSLWCFGFRALFQEDMIFEKIGDKLWGEEKYYTIDKATKVKKGLLPEWICKPLFQCPPCMSSIHGTYAFFSLFDHHHINILDTVSLWVAFCVCLCGLNYLITKIVLE
jgi:hypothetical protein